MPSRINIGPENGPYVAINESSGNLQLEDNSGNVVAEWDDEQSQWDFVENDISGVGAFDSESVNTEGANIKERNLTLGEDTSTDDDDTTVLGGGAKVEVGEDPTGAGTNESLAIGTDALVEDAFSVAVGHGAESIFDAEEPSEDRTGVAVGWVATARGHSATAVGADADAGANSVALGRKAIAKSQGGIAIGDEAEGHNSIAMGREAKATDATQAIAIGDATSAESNAVVVGVDATAHSENQVILGNDAEGQEAAARGVAIGRNSEVRGDAGVAIGLLTVGAEQSVAIGDQADTANNELSVAIGRQSSVEEPGATAVGWDTTVTGNGGVAIGRESTAGGDGVALGNGADAGSNEGVINIGGVPVMEMDSSGNVSIAGELTENATL